MGLFGDILGAFKDELYSIAENKREVEQLAEEYEQKYYDDPMFYYELKLIYQYPENGLQQEASKKVLTEQGYLDEEGNFIR